MIELPSPAAPRVSIVIVVASATTSLLECLRRLAALEQVASFETIVVLNAVPDAVGSRIRESVAGVRVEESVVDVGFAGALNLGRSVARGELIVSLHDDAEVQSGWLDALVETVDGDPAIGAVGSLVLGEDGRVRAAGWNLHQDGRTSPPWEGDAPPAETFTDPRAVDYSASCSLLVRASTWDRIGGADERLFPVYYVDVDLCLAIRARGERVVVQPHSVVLHDGGASTHRDFAEFVSRRNRELMTEKWGAAISEHIPGSGAILALAEGSVPAQHADSDLRSRLNRSKEVSQAYAADLRLRLEAGTAELEARTAELEARTAELEARSDEVAALRRRCEELESLVLELDRLRQRSDYLTLIEQTGWWRLRGRLLPLLRIVTSARRAAAGLSRLGR